MSSKYPWLCFKNNDSHIYKIQAADSNIFCVYGISKDDRNYMILILFVYIESSLIFRNLERPNVFYFRIQISQLWITLNDSGLEERNYRCFQSPSMFSMHLDPRTRQWMFELTLSGSVTNCHTITWDRISMRALVI